MLAMQTRPEMNMSPMVIDQSLATPATCWNGQKVIATQAKLLALHDQLPKFHREPFVMNGIINPNYDVIVADGSDYPITTVSKSYGLMQHEVVFEKAIEGLTNLGFDVASLHAELSLTQYGERFKMSLTLPGYDFDPGDGCPLVLKMNLLNSVDKSTAVTVELEWLRLICGNGMMYGIGSSGFRKAHFRGIDEDDIAGYLDIALGNIPQDRSLMSAWLGTSVSLGQTMPWIDHAVADLWGVPTASRLWHILRYGQDAKAEIVRGEKFEALAESHATQRPVTPLGPVPGAFAPISTAYHAAQALSWVAKENNNLGTRLRRVKEIPALMSSLLGDGR